MADRAATPEGGPGLAAKVAFLASPDAYPEGTAGVDTRETHMSWVFLTDRHAYKLKKPVRYPFLDFSTLEARRQNCEAEVRLNRRLAPDVYLGVAALAIDAAGRLRLEGSGQTVDWLVKMRRLPAERTLEHAILTRSLRALDLDRLGETLARFFRDAVPEPIAPAEYRNRIARDVLATRDELARPKFDLPRALVGETATRLTAFLEAAGDLLEARAAAGRVVEGHGDLRPEHVYLGDPPIVMDCLEFNRDFRILDPVDELAYLAVECERLGDAGVEARLFRAYRLRTGDEPPAALVLFYKAYRAFVRAKIAIWHLDEPDRRDRPKWRQRAAVYLRLAERYVASPEWLPGAPQRRTIH